MTLGGNPVPPDTRADAAGANLFLGRQPILDRAGELFAFELLFRSGTRNAAQVGDEIQATAVVITSAFTDLGIESVLGRFRGFINLSESLLMSDLIELLPRDKVVLEVLETVRPTPLVAARCAELRKLGFSLALDDVVSADPAFEPLLPAVEFIKIDVMGVAPGRLRGLAMKYKARGLAPLAEKVEDRAKVDECLALGFDYFQGYYFARPQVISGRKLTTAEATLLELLGLVLSDAEQSAIERVLKRDPALTINLMRLTNSVASGARRRVTSLANAIVVLGRRQLQRWLQLLLYANDGKGGLLNPLMQLAATRGRFMELAAPAAAGGGSADLAFIAGIMSLMDALLKRPLAEVLASMPVPGEVKVALLERGGDLGALLTLCEALERVESPAIAAAMEKLPGLDAATVNAAQADALRWANSIGEAGE